MVFHLSFSKIISNLIAMLAEKLVASLSLKIEKMEDYFVYKKLLRLILAIGDKEAIDYVETLFARSKNIECMIILLEEETKYGHPTENSEKLFLEICQKLHPNLEVIKKFLQITHKTYGNLTIQILNCKLYNLLAHLVSLTNNELQILDDIVPRIFSHPHHDKTELVKVAIQTMGLSHKFNMGWIYLLGYDFLVDQLLSNFFFNLKAIIAFSQFLLDIDTDRLSKFEVKFVEEADSHSLLKYAQEFPASNKRLIFRHIINKRIGARDDQYLVEFIRTFPEFKVLLPML